jgi:hypothetical protein
LREHHYRALGPHAAFTILAVVGSAPVVKGGQEDRWDERMATAADRYEAILAVARATFAVGGRIVMPADRAIAPVVASIALDYAELPATERTVAPTTPLAVIDTGGYDDTLDALLQPYAARGAVTRYDADGEPMATRPREPRELDPSAGHRHPVTDALIERWQLAGAVYVSPDDAAADEIGRLEARGIEVAVLALDDPLESERHGHRDAVRRMMQDRRRRWLPREHAEAGRRPMPPAEPYAYVAQRLIARWTGGHAPPALS